jgi:hypothetical protein
MSVSQPSWPRSNWSRKHATLIFVASIASAAIPVAKAQRAPQPSDVRRCDLVIRPDLETRRLHVTATLDIANPAWADIHLGPVNAMRAFEMLGGGTLLPIHWGTFDLSLHRWDEPAETLVTRAEKNGASTAGFALRPAP